jgi:ATP-dependent Lon protease
VDRRIPAVQQRADKLTGQILCLVGPPGRGRQIDRAGDWARIRARVARRRDEAELAGIAHLAGLDARQGHPADAQGKILEPAVPARRRGQDRRRIPRAIAKRGLDSSEWAIDDEALLLLMRRHTQEPGVTLTRP